MDSIAMHSLTHSAFTEHKTLNKALRYKYLLQKQDCAPGVHSLDECPDRWRTVAPGIFRAVMELSAGSQEPLGTVLKPGTNDLNRCFPQMHFHKCTQRGRDHPTQKRRMVS